MSTWSVVEVVYDLGRCSGLGGEGPVATLTVGDAPAGDHAHRDGQDPVAERAVGGIRRGPENRDPRRSRPRPRGPGRRGARARPGSYSPSASQNCAGDRAAAGGLGEAPGGRRPQALVAAHRITVAPASRARAAVASVEPSLVDHEHLDRVAGDRRRARRTTRPRSPPRRGPAGTARSAASGRPAPGAASGPALLAAQPAPANRSRNRPNSPGPG